MPVILEVQPAPELARMYDADPLSELGARLQIQSRPALAGPAASA